MNLIFGCLQIDRPNVHNRWDVLLGVVAGLTVTIEGRCFLHLDMFPIVELAASLRHWLEILGTGQVEDFNYDSMESAEGPLLRFIRQDTGWRLYSPSQVYEEGRLFTVQELRDAANSFIEAVRRESVAQLRIDVDSILMWDRASRS